MDPIEHATASLNSWRAIVKDLAVGSVAGAAGIVVGHPLDTIRVRLQTSPKHVYSGAFDCAKKMISQESAISLFRGMSAPLVGVGIQNAILFAAYGGFKDLCSKYNIQNGLECKPTLFQYYMCGLVAGTANLVVTTPMELIKVRMQTSKSAEGHRSSLQELLTILKNDGLKGCFRGFTMTMLRDSPSYGIYFAVYEYGVHHWTMVSKSFGMDGMISASLADTIVGGSAGVVSWATIYPVDVVKSRIQATNNVLGKGTKAPISGTRVAYEMYRSEGISSFFRGFHLCLVRAFPVNAATFFVYGFLTRLLEQSDTTV
eukprot:TRINITY_DN7301_c0_g1_i2.p1 TRINITY_DN7301_c0_g1~~TRINITY_DN7301_c0_g1_i2.p1  ORF type:complete len:315 (-),score=44.80 TRINITY_DN7301_c0_g1_i2:132-1076(-)